MPNLATTEELLTGDTQAFQHAASAAVPRTIGNLELLEELGRGGMGLVLKGRDADLGRDVAVKVLLEKHRDRPELTHRFLKEARINGQLQHPGIVPVYELGRFADERPYFAMKLVEGRTLAELLHERNDPAQDRARFVKIFEQVCQTLAYAHARHVIHRDLKPHNIMVGAFGEVQVMDWGLGKVLGDVDLPLLGSTKQCHDNVPLLGEAKESHDEFATQAGVGLGTLAYMPPEQARGDAEQVDAHSDVFGLGAILCEILTGDPPYPTKDATERHRQAKDADLADAFARLDRCGADAELISIAKRCLAPDPGGRPRDAGVLTGEVTAYLESVEARLRRAELDRAAAEVEAREQRRRRKLTLALATAVIVVVALLGGGALWLQSQYADTERNVEAALAKAEQSHDQFRQMPAATAPQAAAALVVLRQALAAAEEAASVLETGVASDELTMRVTELQSGIHQELLQLEREEQLFRQLDAARMARLSIVALPPAARGGGKPTDAADSASTLNYSGSAQQYETAFNHFGLHVATENMESCARIIGERRKPVREALIVALDDWAFSAALPEAGAATSPQRLLDLAQSVDDDAARKNLRKWRIERDALQLRAAAQQALKTRQAPVHLELLAFSLQDLGQSDAAITLLRRARIEHANDAYLHLQLFNLLYDKPERSDSELQEAIGCVTAAVALRPDSDAALSNLGAALVAANDWEGAIVALERALEINPNFASTHNNLGVALDRKRDWDAAIAGYRRALDINPRFALAQNNLGVALKAKGDLQGAAAAYQAATEINPQYVEAWYNLGTTAQALHDLHAAAAAFRRATELDPQHVDAFLNLGNVLAELGDADGAVVAYTKAIEINPQHAPAHFNLGNVLASRNDMDRAMAAFQAAIAADPDLAEAHDNLGNVLWYKNDHDAAIAEYKAAIKINPRLAKAHSNLGTALWSKRQFAEAVAAYKAAIKIDPGIADLHCNLGLVLKDLGDLDGAVAAYKAALEVDPRFALAHKNLGDALILQQDLDGGIAALEAAIDIEPRYPQAWFNLSNAQAKQGTYVVARESMRRCFDLLPPEDPIRRNAQQRIQALDRLIEMNDRPAENEPIDAQ